MVKILLGLGLLFICSVPANSFAQNSLTKGGTVQDLPIKKLLNDTSLITSFNQLQNKITVIDFFGTWCAPCLRALPHLNEIKQQFKDDINIVLVSNETEVQLNKFIKARKNFSFPVIVDENNQWTNFFRPPSLPYTVVVKQGKVIAVTKAEAITNTAIQQWLTEKIVATVATKNEVKTESKADTMNANQKSSNTILRLSQDYIYAAKTGDSLASISSQLKSLNYETLVKTLTSDNLKKAFWINIYNGYTQEALKANPELYKNRNAFFTAEQVEIAGKRFSLDDIEHGFLRHSKIKWSLGHINKLFPSDTEKELRVANVDYRIHFALNCGAKSCPPIAFYNPDIIDKQLHLATNAYLSGEAEYDSTTNILKLPKLMSWFRADFGGKNGMIEIVRKLDLIPANINPKIEFKEYDWTLSLDNYKANE